MRTRIPKSTPLSFYIDPRILEAIHRAVNVPYKETTARNGYQHHATEADEEDGELLDEEVVDD